MTSSDIQNVTLSANSDIILPTNLVNKEIFLNISCGNNDIVITFKNGTETSKVKLALNSYNVFQLSVNGTDYIIERKSTSYPTLTSEEEGAGVQI